MLAQGEDEVDLAGLLVELLGDLDGGVALIGEVVDLARDGVGVFAGGVLAVCSVELFEPSDALIGEVEEVFEACCAVVELRGEAARELLGVGHDLADGVGAGVLLPDLVDAPASGVRFLGPLLGAFAEHPQERPEDDHHPEDRQREGEHGLGRGVLRVGQEGDVRVESEQNWRPCCCLSRGAACRPGVNVHACYRTTYHVRMSVCSEIRIPSRRDPAVSRIVRAWRVLTAGGGGQGGRRGAAVLAACSGGADSSALVLALAAAGAEFTVAHVVHDMRPRDEAVADRDATEMLARAVGRPFVESAVRVRGASGNVEARARRLRYAALAGLARGCGLGFVATGHHAGDQFESVLMGLLRGAGPEGMRGIAPGRRLECEAGGRGGPVLIRPVLGVDRSECERVCREAGWAWREDRTNEDTTRLRAALRHGVIPELLRLRPGAGRAAGRSARLMRDASALIAREARVLLDGAEWSRPRGEDGGAARWRRGVLRDAPAAVVGAVLRGAAARVRGGKGADSLGWGAIGPCVRAVRDRSGEPRRFMLAGVEVRVGADHVAVQRKES